jgi:enoyl-CoA hydratase/carnithine racemase
MSTGPLLCERPADGVALWRLNRPEVLNALNEPLLRALLAATEEARRDPAVGCVVLTGAGRAFCAGGDLKAMLAMKDKDEFRAYIELYQRFSATMRQLGKPSLAAVNGYALAGGFELALLCDLRIAAESATFGLPDSALGLSPTSGMTYLLPRVVGLGWAKHLTFTGDSIDARQAERIGLVTRVVPAAELEEAALGLARKIAHHPAVGLRYIKAGLDLAADVDFHAALAFETEAEVACFETEEFQARLRAFAKRKQP